VELLKKRYSELFENDENIPDWHEEIVKERIEEYNANPDDVLDYETTIKELKEELLKRRA
jgi:adenylate kinase family enzyme